MSPCYTHREVDSDDVTKPLLVVEEGCEVGDDDDQHGWDVDRHEVTEYAPTKLYLDRNTLHPIVKLFIRH